jgi:hypothetical protein
LGSDWAEVCRPGGGWMVRWANEAFAHPTGTRPPCAAR